MWPNSLLMPSVLEQPIELTREIRRCQCLLPFMRQRKFLTVHAPTSNGVATMSTKTWCPTHYHEDWQVFLRMQQHNWRLVDQHLQQQPSCIALVVVTPWYDSPASIECCRKFPWPQQAADEQKRKQSRHFHWQTGCNEFVETVVPPGINCVFPATFSSGFLGGPFEIVNWQAFWSGCTDLLL